MRRYATVDELKDREAYTTMSFTEFLEAIGRLADVKDLPTKEDLLSHGYKSVLEAIADTERVGALFVLITPAMKRAFLLSSVSNRSPPMKKRVFRLGQSLTLSAKRVRV